MKIEVYGAGCAKCENLASLVKQVVDAMKLDARVLHVSDVARLIEAGVMMTPALAINGKLKCQGRSPSAEELRKWLTGARK